MSNYMDRCIKIPLRDNRDEAGFLLLFYDGRRFRLAGRFLNLLFNYFLTVADFVLLADS